MSSYSHDPLRKNDLARVISRTENSPLAVYNPASFGQNQTGKKKKKESAALSFLYWWKY